MPAFNPLLLIKGGALIQICRGYRHHRPAKFLFLDLARLPRTPAPLALTHDRHLRQYRTPMYIALCEDPGELSNEDPPVDALRDDHPFREQVEIKEDKGHVGKGGGQRLMRIGQPGVGVCE